MPYKDHRKQVENAHRHYVNHKQEYLTRAQRRYIKHKDAILANNKIWKMNNKEKLQNIEVVGGHRRRGIKVSLEKVTIARKVPCCKICGRDWNDVAWNDVLGRFMARMSWESDYEAFVHNFCNISKRHLGIFDFQSWIQSVYRQISSI